MFDALISLLLAFHALVSVIVGGLPVCETPDPALTTGEAVTLPLGGGADPWYYAQDGMYYYCYSVGNGVAVKCAQTLSALYGAEGKTVYTAPENTAYSRDYWAPELHCIDGRWYIYVAADDGQNENHRMYVLSCDSPTGSFQMEGKLSDPTDKWAIDGTVLQYADALWFVWSGWAGDTDGQQNLYIAHMSDPTHIDGERYLLSEPTRRWEKRGMPINEGPEALVRGDGVFIVYSASGSWTDDYCLGMLTFCGGDITDRSCWKKSLLPVFSKAKTAYGPGHCSFVQSPDGAADYIVYHANTESGTGWSGRSVRIQPFFWRNGAPVFGRPLPVDSVVYL